MHDGQKRRALRLVGAVVKFERNIAPGEMPRHRQDRRDADPAGDEDMTRSLRQWKVIARSRSRYDRTDGQVVVDPARGAAPVILALDCYLINGVVVRIPAQRILSDPPVRQM